MHQEFDAQGRLVELTTWSQAGMARTRWEYAPLTGWLARKLYPGGTDLRMTYGPGGALDTLTSGHVTTTFHYDSAGALSSLRRGNSNEDVQFLERDRLGRPHRVDAGTNSTLLAYHPAGRVVSETFHDWRVTNTLDSSGRMVGLQLFPKGATTPALLQQLQYDGASRLREIAAGPVRVTYQYAANSSLMRELLYRHNGELRLVTTFTYDNRGRLTEVGSASGSAPALTFNYQYNAAGQRIKLTEVDGSAWIYRYDDLGQLTSGRRRWADGVTVPGQQFEYAFDELGNRTTVRVGGDAQGGGMRTAGFVANILNQYDSRVNPAILELFGQAPSRAAVTLNERNPERYYDHDYFHLPLLVEHAGAAEQPVLARASLHQISRTNAGSIFLPPINETFTYDGDGHLLTDGRWRYTWDAAGRLTGLEAHASLPDALRARISFTYDFRGRRLTKSVWDWNPGTRDYQFHGQTKFVYDGWRLLAELDANDAVLRSYVWGTERSDTRDGSAGVGGLLAMLEHQTGVAYFYVSDAAGNIRALVSAADGQIAGRYDYGPFGEPLRATGERARQNPFRFSTHYQDDETELVYFGYRYYSPGNGRWLSRDPLGEKGGLALYAYAGNDPVNRFDALGLRAEFPRRDLARYRSCRRQAETTSLLQGGVGPGDYRKDCCELITVLVKLPLCLAQGLTGKGFGGHSGMGINDEYYDYGPAMSVNYLTALTGVPGSQWWDDPVFPVWNTNVVQSPDDIMLSDIVDNSDEVFARDPFGPEGESADMFKVEIAVTSAEAGRARDYWRNKYQEPGRYTVFGSQCSTTVMHSLEQAGVYHRPFLTLSPMGLLKSLHSTTHTCGPNRGQRVRFEQISWDSAVAGCGTP
jgi:RHS repeat-associated protein